MRHVLIMLAVILATRGYTDETMSLSAQHHMRLSEEQKEQVMYAIAAFNTIKAKQVVYVSSPISSGKRLYDYMDANGFATPEEAKKDFRAFFYHVMLPNVEESERVSSALAEQIEGVVIAPTAFERRFSGVQGFSWGQSAFMSLWLSFMEEKVTHIVMLDGWQYSNGASEEFLQAVRMQNGLSVRTEMIIMDARGEVLTADQGIELIVAALEDIHRRGLRADALEKTLDSLVEIQDSLVL